MSMFSKVVVEVQCNQIERKDRIRRAREIAAGFREFCRENGIPDDGLTTIYIWEDVAIDPSNSDIGYGG